MSVLKPEDVFTPRAAAVNLRTYISRPDLEQSLTTALRLPKHVVIHGESGSGKTWLYKKVLADLNYHIEVANMGLCAGLGSIANVLKTNICRQATTGGSHSFVAGGGIPGLAKLNATQTSSSEKYNDAFLESLKAVRTRAQHRPACLVFDNLEQVVQERTLVRELAGYLLLLDDEQYANEEVKILLVGTSDEIRNLIAQIKTSAPVANRISEIPEVARLSHDQAAAFVNTGMYELLGCETHLDTDEYRLSIANTISYHSDRIPLHIQELCFYVASNAEQNEWVLARETVISGIKDWIKSSLVADVSRVQHNLNSIATKIGRRNQVLYCLGNINNYDFSASSVENSLKEHFKGSSQGIALNIPQILSDLAKSEHPLIRKNPNSAFYRFIDPKYRIVIRWLLHKREDSEEIVLRDFDSALGLWTEAR